MTTPEIPSSSEALEKLASKFDVVPVQIAEYDTKDPHKILGYLFRFGFKLLPF